MQNIDSEAFSKAVVKAHELGWDVSDEDALNLLMSGATKPVHYPLEDGDRSAEEMLIIGFYIMARDGIDLGSKKVSK